MKPLTPRQQKNREHKARLVQQKADYDAAINDLIRDIETYARFLDYPIEGGHTAAAKIYALRRMLKIVFDRDEIGVRKVMEENALGVQDFKEQQERRIKEAQS